MIERAPPEMSRDVMINMVAICLALISASMVQTMLLVAVPLSALELGASSLLVGVILSAPYLLPLFLAIPVGSMITRSGARKFIIAGSVGMAMGPLAALIVPGFSGLILAQLIVGIAHMVMALAGQSIVSGLGQGKSLERYFGWYTTCVSVGQLAGPLLAGWLIDYRGTKLSFIVVVIIAMLAVIGGFFLTGSAKKGQQIERSLLGYRAQASLLKTNPAVRISIALTVAVVFALGAFGNFLPVYLESLSMSATAIGALVSLRAFCAMAVRPFIPSVIDLMGGRSAAIIWSAVLVASGLMFIGLVDNLCLLAILAILIGIGSGTSQPLSMVTLVEHVPAAQRPSALGMRLVGNRGVQFLAPLSLGLLAEIAPFSVTFLFGGVFVFLFVGLIMYLIPAFKELESSKQSNDQGR